MVELTTEAVVDCSKYSGENTKPHVATLCNILRYCHKYISKCNHSTSNQWATGTKTHGQ